MVNPPQQQTPKYVVDRQTVKDWNLDKKGSSKSSLPTDKVLERLGPDANLARREKPKYKRRIPFQDGVTESAKRKKKGLSKEQAKTIHDLHKVMKGDKESTSVSTHQLEQMARAITPDDSGQPTLFLSDN